MKANRIIEILRDGGVLSDCYIGTDPEGVTVDYKDGGRLPDSTFNELIEHFNVRVRTLDLNKFTYILNTLNNGRIA